MTEIEKKVCFSFFWSTVTYSLKSVGVVQYEEDFFFNLMFFGIVTIGSFFAFGLPLCICLNDVIIFNMNNKFCMKQGCCLVHDIQ